MSVSEEKDSTSGKIILLYQKNKIKLSINNKVIWGEGAKGISSKAINNEIKLRTLSKSRLKKSISEGKAPEVFTKKNCFSTRASKLPSDTIKKENVIFLIVLQRSNFRYRFPQKFLGLWGMEVAHYIKIVRWASNSPRINLQ